MKKVHWTRERGVHYVNVPDVGTESGTAHYHAVEAVADVKPDYALPLGAKHPVVTAHAPLSDMHKADVLANPDSYNAAVLAEAKGEAPCTPYRIIARSATSGRDTMNVCRGIEPDVSARMAEAKKERLARTNKRKGRGAISADVQQEIVQRHKVGQSTRWIADVCRVSVGTVSNVLKRHAEEVFI